MKGLAIELGTYNAMLWRTMVAMLLAGCLVAWKRSPWPERKVLKLHVWRGSITSVMAYLFFWGIVYVPLAEAIALSFIAPLIAMYLAKVLLNERIGPQAVLASIIGFSGAIVIVAGKLGGDYDDKVWLGIAAILVSAVFYAYNLILQRQQAIVAKPFEIAFFQNGTVFGHLPDAGAVSRGSAAAGTVCEFGQCGDAGIGVATDAVLGLCSRRGAYLDPRGIHGLYLGGDHRLYLFW